MVIFTKMYALYKEKEQNFGPKIAMPRKIPGHIVCVEALVFILCKEDTQNLYK
jgi:hypothetical protein